LSDLSDLSDQKKEKITFSGENHHKEEGFTQVSSKDPGSVRHGSKALCHNDFVKMMSDKPYRDNDSSPTPEQLAHARRMLVDCPSTGGKRHCWYCSGCEKARTCAAWRTRRRDVEFYRHSGKPSSLALVEGHAPGPVASAAPDYATFCSDYWRGCFQCPDYLPGPLQFCAKYNRQHAEASEALQ
jgi:hypothetical protein